MSELHVLIPDLPDTEALLPWLRRIDRARRYTNAGPLLDEFETGVAATFDPPGDIGVAAVASGTTALDLALAALELPPGGRVLLPALTFPATALAVLRCGLQPVLADVDRASWTLTPEIASAAHATAAVDAVLPVAAYGMPLPVDAWSRFRELTGLAVLFDAAAAFGNQRLPDRIPVVFSLHATKPFGIGEGGLVVCRDAGFIARVQRLGNFGFDAGVIVAAGGGNGKLSEYHAAVGLAQLARWPALAARRIQLWDRYRKDLAQLGDRAAAQAGPGCAPAMLVLRLPSAAQRIREALAEIGIGTRRWYCPPLHRHPALADLQRIGPQTAELPVSDALGETLLGLPFHTLLSTEDVARACGGVAKILANGPPRD